MADAGEWAPLGHATVKTTHGAYGEPSNVHGSLNPAALGLKPDDHADN